MYALEDIKPAEKQLKKKWLTFLVSFSFDWEASLILVTRLPPTIQFQLKLEPIQFVLCKLDFYLEQLTVGLFVNSTIVAISAIRM